MAVVLVTENRDPWLKQIADVEIVDPREYLTDPNWSRRRGIKLYNLSNSYRYQSLGYYVSLLAEARGHRPLPGVTTLQDLQGLAAVQFVSEELQQLIDRSLHPIQTDRFTLSVYFGRNLAQRYERLSRELYSLFSAPLLRFQFSRGQEKWRLRRAEAIPIADVPPEHLDFLADSARRHFEGRSISRPKKASLRYDLAILHDPHEGELAPSDTKALEKMIRAAASVGLAAQLITRQDAGRLLEFDALFIRQTTSVNHYTYRMARRAEREGLIVIDDPTSIARCTNKVYLAELLDRHNIATPKTIVAQRGSVARIGDELGWPIVIKRPDGAFSQGVVKVEDQADWDRHLESFFSQSELIIAQEYLPTAFDWRIGILDGRPLFACKYHMARGHWQIISHDAAPKDRYGKFETMAVEAAPRKAVAIAQKAAALMGNGLYGVDVKETEGRFVIIEVNDNPNLDAGVEDQVLRDELYRRIMEWFLRRIERKKMGEVES
jgi:glutathione synthase/RimK-type ligase-like ATP-grasp enzyme